MMRYVLLALLCVLALAACGCDQNRKASSDDIQRAQQEQMLQDATSQVGMPAIKNFRERKLYKDILELRDQDGLTTYSYLYNEMQGKLVFLGESIGYGIPYATQFTNPQKIEYAWRSGVNSMAGGPAAIAQADPNGLFSPAAAEGTWILLKNPNGKDVKPVYVEPRVIVSPFRLDAGIVAEKVIGD